MDVSISGAVFSYLTINTARWTQATYKKAPRLFYRYGQFTIGSEHNRHWLILEMHPARPEFEPPRPACVKVS